MRLSSYDMNEHTRIGNRLTQRCLWLCGLGLLGLGTGCLTIEQMAPPVTSAFTAHPRSTLSLATLEQGRSIYVQDCTRCHSAEPIVRYSKDRWEHIIARMAPESRLDESRTAALQAYVFAAHDVLALHGQQATPRTQ